MNRIERIAREFDCWQQRHRPIAFAVAVAKKFSDDQAGNLVGLLAYFAFLATFPLLLALTTILGLVLRNSPRLQRDLLNSAFAEFPIIGAQIHDQLGVATFGNTFSLIIGLLGAFYGGRGFANALQNTVSSVWAVPRADRPGFPANYLRTIALLLLLTVGVAVTAAASAAAGAATAWGLSGFAAHLISIGVGSVLGWGYFLAAYRVATPAQVPTRWMLPGAAVSAVAWQLLLTGAGVIIAHLLRHAQAVAGLFGVVLGLLAWFGVQATVVVYAVEADVVRAKHLWPRSLTPPPLTEADKAYYSDAIRAQAQRPEQRVQIDYLPQATRPRVTTSLWLTVRPGQQCRHLERPRRAWGQLAARHLQTVVAIPPSIVIFEPVTLAVRSRAKNTTRPATFCGVLKRPSGVPATADSAIACARWAVAAPGVLAIPLSPNRKSVVTGPGLTEELWLSARCRPRRWHRRGHAGPERLFTSPR